MAGVSHKETRGFRLEVWVSVHGFCKSCCNLLTWQQLPCHLLPVWGCHSGVIHMRRLAQVLHRMPFLMQPGFESETSHVAGDGTTSEPPGKPATY